MFTYFLIGVLVLGVLALVVLAVLVVRIASWRYTIPEFEVCTPESFPAEQLDALRALADQLGGSGLIFAGLQHERRGGGEEWWQAVFHSEDGKVWAVAERRGRKKPRLVLHSLFPEGRAVTTSSGEFADYNVTDDWRLTEQKFGDIESQVTLHRQKMLGGGTDILPVQTLEEFQRHYLDTTKKQIEHLSAKGFFSPVPDKPNLFKVVPWKDPLIALKMLLHSTRNKLAERGREMDAEFQKQLEAERAERERYAGIAEYKYLEFYKEDKKRGTALETLGWTKTGAILFFSIIALVILFYAQGALDGTTVLIIGGILLFHELGHVAMMILFRYRDLHVLFIPLLARLAPEKNIRVHSFKEFLVLLMGPLPGLLIGWGLLVWGYFDPALPEFWREVGLWAAIINNINFLAILPADGGRVVNLLIFERVPALRLIYLILSAVSVLATVFIYWITMDTFLWPVLVVLVSTFLAIPDNWRHAKMGPWAKYNLDPDDNEYDALIKAFQIVEITDSTRGLEKRGWTNFVERVVRYGCARKLGFFGTAGSLLFFFFFLYTPFYVIGILAVSDAMIVASQGSKLDERLEELSPAASEKAKPLGGTTQEALEILHAAYREEKEVARAELNAMAGPGYHFELTGAGAAAESGEEERSDVDLVRVIDWSEAVTWVAEDESVEREEVLASAIRILVDSAADGIDREEVDTPMSDLSKAWWGLASCEPRSSLGVWIDWLYLEQSMLQQLERVSRQGKLPPRYAGWFAKTLPDGPKPEGRRLAYLLLKDLKAEDALAGAGIDAASLEAAREDPFSIGGFRLNRSQADRDFMEKKKKEEGLPDLRKVLGFSRALQGLPTAEEFHAGLIVADDWESQGVIDSVPLDELDNDQQRELWKARLDAIQRLVHFRKLAVSALEIESAERSRGVGRHTLAEANRLAVPVKMQDNDGDFTLKATAPDGSELIWHLSPNPLR